ncbi:hypothetical protein WAI453_000509 [Rhynchosporium graminicola]
MKLDTEFVTALLHVLISSLAVIASSLVTAPRNAQSLVRLKVLNARSAMKLVTSAEIVLREVVEELATTVVRPVTVSKIVPMRSN